MFEESDKLKEIAGKLVKKHERVSHVNIDNVLWLYEFRQKPKAAARCYSWPSHPIMNFVDKEFH